MQIISPDTIDRIGRKVGLIGEAAAAVNAARSEFNLPAVESAQRSLAASEADYEKALSELSAEQRGWVEHLFADALTLARAGRTGSEGIRRAQDISLTQIKWADDQIRELETITAEMKAARSRWVQAALSYDVSAYQVAKTCGRTPSTVQRWVQ